jgi:hypothetical protein
MEIENERILKRIANIPSKWKQTYKKKEQRVCKHFLQGNCKYGERCYDLHTGRRDPKEQRETRERSDNYERPHQVMTRN